MVLGPIRGWRSSTPEYIPINNMWARREFVNQSLSYSTPSVPLKPHVFTRLQPLGRSFEQWQNTYLSQSEYLPTD